MRRLRTASHAKFTADLVCELRKQCGGGDDGAVGDHDAIADGLEVVAPSGVMLCLLRCTVVLEAVVFNDELFVGPEQIWVKIALGNEVSIAGLGHDRSVGNGLRKTVASKLAGQAEKQIENGLIGGTQVVDGKVDGPERLRCSTNLLMSVKERTHLSQRCERYCRGDDAFGFGGKAVVAAQGACELSELRERQLAGELRQAHCR